MLCSLLLANVGIIPFKSPAHNLINNGREDLVPPKKDGTDKYYTITEPATAALAPDNNNKASDDEKLKKITIQKMNKETGLIDIHTYHHGRVGDEPRDPANGELLCEDDPIDTNHNWVPPKLLVKVTVAFPLEDPDEEDYHDSDLSDDEREVKTTQHDVELSMMRASPTRASLTRSKQRSTPTTDRNTDSPDKKETNKEPTRFVQTVDWDLGDPSTPTAEEYAANIASEFGLSFPQTMDLKESIQKQLPDFTHRQSHFYAPIKILDPYGNERPNSNFGPPERHCGSVCGSVSKPSIRRAASGASSSRRSTGGGSSSSRGAVKPDKRGISVVPKNQIERPNQSGNKFAEEILKRCKITAKAKTAEMISNGQPALKIAKNEVCHICHNRKESVLCFPCGRHAYCDYHCGARLSCRVRDYDPQTPTNMPIDYCPVCTLHCTCSRCVRRLETLSTKVEEQCEKQQCGPSEVVMDELTQLCADGTRHGIGNTKKKSKDKEKKRRRSDEGDGTPRPSPSSRSSRSSPILLDDVKPPPKKQRKTEPIIYVPVPKVHPSEFPTELLGLSDVDPSDPSDMAKIFTPEGAYEADDSSPGISLPAAASKYQDIIEMQIEKHFTQNCARCIEEGTEDRICCSNCPRSYHTKCFEQGEDRVCKRCGTDKEILQEDEILESLSVDEKINSAYSHLSQSSNFTLCGILLSQIKDILEKLKGYDYGWVFAEPGKVNVGAGDFSVLDTGLNLTFFHSISFAVNTDEVQDYLDIIKRPMDYSTIVERLEQGAYASDLENNSADGADAEMDRMEEVLFKVLCDVDQVHHNCFTYNLKNSAFYNAGVVQQNKWDAYFGKYVQLRLTENIKSAFDKFRLNCKEALSRLKHGQRFIKVKSGSGVNCRQYAVFDPDTKRIIKQYTSRASSRLAALALLSFGYQCEWDLTEQNAKTRVENSRDPKKLLFGYQWLPTDELKSGKFKMKEIAPHEISTSATTTNVLILKEDTVSGTEIRGFESEESAYQDWMKEKASSVAATDDNAEASNISEFVTSYVDGQAAINGIIYKRVLSNQDELSRSVQRETNLRNSFFHVA